MFSASGAVDPGESIRKQRDDSPWSLCRRPWSLMYITANGRVLPCCIAPFSMKGYGSFTLGDATQEPSARSGTAPNTSASAKAY